MPSESLDPDQVAAALALLERLVEERGLLASLDDETRKRLTMAAGRVGHPDAKAQRNLARAFRKQAAAARRAADEAALARTGMRAAQAAPVFATPAPAPALADAKSAATVATAAADPSAAPPPADSADAPPDLRKPRDCYICKSPYTKLHAFYDSLCPECGDFNYAKRTQSADLSGRVALVTGGRVKIGYHAVIKLLRAGARVVVTTRFARDAAARLAREEDFAAWRDRLEIYGLDLRHTPSVERLAEHLLATLPSLDFIVHNACQTVRRPPGFYAHLLERETAPLDALPPAERELVARYEELRHGEGAGAASIGIGAAEPARLSQRALTPEDRALLPGGAMTLFPEGQLDRDLQQVDLRAMNSWRLRMHEVPTVELLEVQLVNAVAPFVLSARLKPLMLREPHPRDRHVVNVSAMEGQFNRTLKTPNHPHTNMAKAALNMLTRTSAQDWAKDGIHMNSVDTGWVTDEDPVSIAARKAQEQGAEFHPPLDVVDGAARILDPIFDGLNTGRHLWGLFLKDYRPTPW